MIAAGVGVGVVALVPVGDPLWCRRRPARRGQEGDFYPPRGDRPRHGPDRLPEPRPARPRFPLNRRLGTQPSLVGPPKHIRAIFDNMATYSVSDAKSQLSNLIDRALVGEGVVIARRGEPVVELKPVRPVSRPITEADLDWLRARRIGSTMPKIDAGQLVSGICDEGEK
jgi:prevent-host-death family protein